MARIFESPAEIMDAVGETFGPTDWVTIDQKRIDMFAESTGDDQWIHVDVERAKTGPYGTTIAHGYLTMSLINLFLPQLIEVRNISMGLNYGLNKVRFPAVVPCGSRVRGRAEMLSVELQANGGIMSIFKVTVEVEGGAKPACVAETLSLWYPG
jgi:acyl dehydratase